MSFIIEWSLTVTRRSSIIGCKWKLGIKRASNRSRVRDCYYIRNIGDISNRSYRSQHRRRLVSCPFFLLSMATVSVSFTDTCDGALSSGNSREATSAKLPCCEAKHTSVGANYAHLNWEPWRSETGARLVDEYIQYDFDEKRTIRRMYTTGFAKKKQFVRSFYVSYSQNSAHWKYITYMGKKKVSCTW